MSLNHILESSIQFSNESRTVSPTNLLTINMSMSADNLAYSLNNMFMKLEVKVKTSATLGANPKLLLAGQPSTLFSTGKTQLTYLDPNTNELKVIEMNSDSENSSAAREVLDLVFLPKSAHRARLNFTHGPYHSQEDFTSSGYSCIPYIKLTGSASATEYTGLLYIPFSSCVPLADCEYFCNIKMLEISLKPNNITDFFATLADGKGCNIVGDNFTVTSNAANISSMTINKCVVYSDPYVGDLSAIDNSFRQIKTKQIVYKSYALKNEDTTYTQNCLVQMPCKYILMWFSNKHDSNKFLDKKFTKAKISVSGAGSLTTTNFDNTNGKDIEFWRNMYFCSLQGREETLMNYDDFQNVYHIFISDIGSQIAQKASNIFQLDLAFDKVDANTYLNVLFVRDDSE